MTTVVDPSGSPVVIFNRSGTAIVTVTAGGTSQGTATAIPRVCGITVAVATYGAMTSNLRLPDDAEVGDCVEVHMEGDGPAVQVYPESGATINGNSANTSVGMLHAIFRKTAAATWFALRIS